MPDMDMPGMDMPGMKNCTCMDMDMTMDMMPMYFHFNIHDILWFKGFKPNNVGSYLGTCLFIFFFAMIKEYVFQYRRYRVAMLAVEKRKLNSSGLPLLGVSTSAREDNIDRVLDAVFYVLNLFFGYMLMLVFMTYNVGYCIVMLLSSGFGYYFLKAYFERPGQLSEEPEVDCCESAE